jgi:hypothetical protein
MNWALIKSNTKLIDELGFNKITCKIIDKLKFPRWFPIRLNFNKLVDLSMDLDLNKFKLDFTKILQER